MGSAGDLERCMMYTAVGVSIVLLMIRFNTPWRLSVRLDEQYVLIQFAHAVTVILTWEAPRNCCRLLSALFRLLQGL